VNKEIQNAYLIRFLTRFLDFVLLFHRDAAACGELPGGWGSIGLPVAATATRTDEEDNVMSSPP
jgi:hypothetical protein